jgi:hypothetical protein
MKQAIKTCVSVIVKEVAINPDGDIFARVEIKYKALQYEKPDRTIQYYLNVSKEIKESNK